MVSNTSVSVSALSSALSVMMSSFPAHFRIFDILHQNDKGKMLRWCFNTVTDIFDLQLQISSHFQKRFILAQTCTLLL